MNFFNQENCDRCGKKALARTMSMFNTDTICMDCKEKEKSHPKYAEAKQAEHDAVVRGDLNFKGIGL